jgi:Ca2+-binding RTX toxin-like protein
MATHGTALYPINMNGSSLIEIVTDVTVASDHSFILLEDTIDGVSWLFTGANLDFNESTLTASGTVDGTAYAQGGITLYTLTGLPNKSAATIGSYVIADNKQGLFNYVFSGSDLLDGSSGADTINGYGGVDDIYGFGGADKLNGGAGDDNLIGGSGHDVLTGGKGADWFYFIAKPAASSSDVIKDLHRAESDKIFLERDVFKLGATFTSSEFKSASNINPNGGVANGTAKILYDSDSGKLYYDADGAGSTIKPILVATLANHPDLALSDFAYGG